MSLNTWFDKGITKEEYMASLEKHREGFMQIYNQFEIPDKDEQELANKQNIRVIALAEVWCGHCMLDIPILLNITEKANIPIRFLPRDEHLELMDQYLTNEKRYIPIIIFIDDEGNELAKWGPMASEIEDYANKLKENIKPKND